MYKKDLGAMFKIKQKLTIWNWLQVDFDHNPVQARVPFKVKKNKKVFFSFMNINVTGYFIVYEEK